MAESEFTVALVDGQVVVTTPDEIDIANSGNFRAALTQAAEGGQPTIIVDMSGTEFCDSTGLSVLVRALKQADQDGGEIRLVVRAAALQRILTVTGVGTMFGVYPDLSQALHAA